MFVCGDSHTLTATFPSVSAAHLLAEQLKSPLLRLVARLHQFLERLLAERVLLLGHNAALVLHQVLLRQATDGVVGRAVPHLRLAAHHAAALAAHHRLSRSRRGA
jgi:hypothetical protein